MFRYALQQTLPPRITLYACTLVVFVFSLATVQDLLHARRNNYSFQLDESVLFNVFWLLFFPLILIQIRYLTIEVPGHPAIRILKLLLVALTLTAIHILLYILAVRNLSAVFFDHTYTYYKNFSYAVSEHLYKCMGAYFTVGLILNNGFLPRQVPGIADLSINPANAPSFAQWVTVKAGRNNLTVAVEDIICINASNPYIALHTADRQHLHSETLLAMEQQLDPKKFIRVHRSTIVNLNKVVSYRSRYNGDYDISMLNNETVRLSRNFVANFKKATSAQPVV